PVPRVVGKIRRRGPVEVRDAAFLLEHATRATKITLPGPFTLSQQAENTFYADEEEMAMDYATAVNEELRALKATGVDVVQLDEPAAETAETIAARLREGLKHVPAERLVAAPDCGMKYLPRATAFAKLQALAAGAAIVRRELAG